MGIIIFLFVLGVVAMLSASGFFEQHEIVLGQALTLLGLMLMISSAFLFGSMDGKRKVLRTDSNPEEVLAEDHIYQVVHTATIEPEIIVSIVQGNRGYSVLRSSAEFPAKFIISDGVPVEIR